MLFRSNNSWGGNGYSSSENSVINNAFNSYGAIIVAAAGNGIDIDADGEPDETGYGAHYPASYENVLSVAALKCNYSTVIWSFTYHKSVYLSAPGDQVLSTINGGEYESWNGSSMVSPNAACVMGLVWSLNPELTNRFLR